MVNRKKRKQRVELSLTKRILEEINDHLFLYKIEKNIEVDNLIKTFQLYVFNQLILNLWKASLVGEDSVCVEFYRVIIRKER